MTSEYDDTLDVDPGDDETTDPDSAADGTAARDTTMAAGARSGAAGVANAELGTSGAPAESLLSPELLARTEVTGGAGLDPNAIGEEELDKYFKGTSTEIHGNE